MSDSMLERKGYWMRQEVFEPPGQTAILLLVCCLSFADMRDTLVVTIYEEFEKSAHVT
jgi:hypothetical protein